MATILSFLSGRQITDDDGEPVAGALLYHYQAGTTNNLTVYSNQAGSIAHAQPVQCDAGGFVPLIYVGDTSDWKVVIQTPAAATLRTYDNLPAAIAEVSASDFAPPLLAWTQVNSGQSPIALTAADAGKAYEANTASGNIEFDLPSAASVGNGKGFFFKKTVAANSLIVDPNSTETIDNSATSLELATLNSLVGIFSNGAEWYRVSSPLTGLKAIQAFTASGTYTPRVGLSHAIVVSTGGGGGGGGADSDGSSNGGAAGGGAGSTCIELFDAATIGASQTVTIGAAGTAGAATGGNGGAGGDTTFGALHTAGGGAGGLGSNPAGADEILAGTAGGTATGGLINIPGGEGGYGSGEATCRGGHGGASFWGGGAVGAISNTSTAIAGRAGAAYGAGGSGAVNANTTAGALGGVGAGGICVVFEFGE